MSTGNHPSFPTDAPARTEQHSAHTAECPSGVLLQHLTECLERLLAQLERLEDLQRHPPPRLIPVAVDITTAAKLCDVGRSLLYELMREGKGPPVAKLGTRTVIRYRTLDAWVAHQEGRPHD